MHMDKTYVKFKRGSDGYLFYALFEYWYTYELYHRNMSATKEYTDRGY